ncbi:hypothetical protein K493DRAFT_263583 [Basidiobolus meristosporus CBS 931.73]|uniref:RING-type domain-containing protein n=1 Tax=Basidiobolus meristosporus CBS 931.73 TaxID=1314790 RepID=A0A1Y1Y3L5_9FUNG|nr:hypothetical protein K493DRAFT_263583 [Basidiobolus meristosporus CBS 931.73]|eukprot:ORX92306.1 hypothetical protein K493DRAFT_263583 [Basidiobolus meristosporus CBS 931.73]
MNHLLNFSLPPRQRPISHLPRKSKSSNHQPFNKERFINANFRFLVNPTGDYTVQSVDPDVNINWEDIEQVIITSQSPVTCPICLSEPCAARVTKCGHIYCYQCVLHYLSVGEEKKKWRKCPVCWDAIYEKDLKSVQHIEGLFLTNKEIKNDSIIFNLMQKAPISNIVLPRVAMAKLNPEKFSEAPFIPWDFTPCALSYARLVLPTTSYMEKEYLRNISELEGALEDAKGWGAQEEMPFINSALEKVKSQLELLRLSPVRDSIEKRAAANMLPDAQLPELTSPANEPASKAHIDEFESVIKAYHENNQEHEPAFSDCEDDESEDSNHKNLNHTHYIETSSSIPYGAMHDAHIYSKTDTVMESSESKGNVKQDSSVADGNYFFYQAADGQHVYLHPLDIKILREEFGAYENFPDEISAPMISLEESTINPELRKRFKYLSHLPVSCDITFVEIDLKNIVSKKTFNMFANELRQRKSKRKQKERKEERQRLLAQEPLYKSNRTPAEDEFIKNDPFFQAPITSLSSPAPLQPAVAPETGHLPSAQAQNWASGNQGGTFAKALESSSQLEYGKEEVLVGKKGKKKHVLMSNNARRRY